MGFQPALQKQIKTDTTDTDEVSSVSSFSTSKRFFK